MTTEASPDRNSPENLRQRLADGAISRRGLLVLLAARTTLVLAGQGLVAAAYLVRGDPSPWTQAGRWWTVFGTLADLGCLALLWRLTRREGIRLRDLVGPVRWGRDLLLGLGYWLVLLPLFAFGGIAGAWLVGGGAASELAAGQLQDRVLPPWAVVYSVGLWWIVWSAVEETTYQGYALPRAEALSGRPWVALLLVGFWWTVQHCALPLVLDARYLAWRLVAFAPGVLVMMLLYRRTRRLAPLVLAHWPMDLAAAVMTLRW